MSYRDWMDAVSRDFYNTYGVEWELLLGDFPTRDFFDDGYSVDDCVYELACAADSRLCVVR